MPSDLVERLARAWASIDGSAKRFGASLVTSRHLVITPCHYKEAVLDAYGWPHTLTDEGILGELLKLNLSRATVQEGGAGYPGRYTLRSGMSA